MLQSCSCRDLGHESFQICIFSTSSKLQTLPSPFKNRVLLGFRLQSPFQNLDSILYSHAQKLISPCGGPKVSPRFKLQCGSRASGVPTEKNPSIFKSKQKKHAGHLTSIVRSLEGGGDIENTLNSFGKYLTRKEQTVVLESLRDWKSVVRVFEFFFSQEEYVPDVYHYNIVLRALGIAQQWDDLRLYWVRMAKDGILPTNHTYGILVDVYEKAGFVKESLLWVKHMRQRGVFPDAIMLNTIVRVLKNAGEFDRADKFYKDWCNGRVDLDGLDFDSMDDFQDKYGSEPVSLKHFLLTELFKTGVRSPSLGSQETETSVQRPMPTSTYNTLIDMYGKAGRLKDAADVFAEMLKYGVAMDTLTFNTMIFTCGTNGYLWEAEALLNEMEKRGLSPDTKTYNTFLSLYANAGDIDAALKCYWRIGELDLFPDVVTNRAILHALCERNMVREVDVVIEDMEKSGLAIDEYSLPSIINMYVKEGLLDRASDLLKKYQFCGSFSSKMRVSLMNTFAEKGLWAETELLFFRKRDSIEKKESVVEYNVMLKAYGKAKLYDKASSLFKEMKKRGTWPDQSTYRSLIQMFAGADMVDQAMDLLAEMQELGFKPTCRTYSSVIACYVRLKQLSEAVDVFQEMERAGVKANEFVYGSLINGLAEYGEFEEVVQYFQKMEESGISANKVVLTSMVKAYAKLGSLEGAKAIYERMEAMGDGLDVVASNSMIGLFADFGLVSESEFVFENLKKKGLADHYSFTIMMQLYKTMNMFHEFNNTVEELKKNGIPWNTVSFNQAMSGYATSGQLRECVELFHEVVPQKLLPNNATMRILITVMKKGNVPSEVVMQLESAYMEGKPYACEAIITSISNAVGLHDFALRTCETFIKADVVLASFAYNVAIKAYEMTGEIDKALNIYKKMQDYGLKPDIVTYVNIAGCYGKARMVEGLKRIYTLLKCGEIEPNKTLFMAVCAALKVARRNDLVYMVKKQMRYAFEDESPDKERTDDEFDDEIDDEFDDEYDDEYDDESDDDSDDSRF